MFITTPCRWFFFLYFVLILDRYFTIYNGLGITLWFIIKYYYESFYSATRNTWISDGYIWADILYENAWTGKFCMQERKDGSRRDIFSSRFLIVVHFCRYIDDFFSPLTSPAPSWEPRYCEECKKVPQIWNLSQKLYASHLLSSSSCYESNTFQFSYTMFIYICIKNIPAEPALLNWRGCLQIFSGKLTRGANVCIYAWKIHESKFSRKLEVSQVLFTIFRFIEQSLVENPILLDIDNPNFMFEINSFFSLIFREFHIVNYYSKNSTLSEGCKTRNLDEMNPN